MTISQVAKFYGQFLIAERFGQIPAVLELDDLLGVVPGQAGSRENDIHAGVDVFHFMRQFYALFLSSAEIDFGNQDVTSLFFDQFERVLSTSARMN